MPLAQMQLSGLTYLAVSSKNRYDLVPVVEPLCNAVNYQQ